MILFHLGKKATKQIAPLKKNKKNTSESFRGFLTKSEGVYFKLQGELILLEGTISEARAAKIASVIANLW